MAKKYQDFSKLKLVNEFIAQSQLDFHELGILTAFDIEKYLSEFIEDSYLENLRNILVITGKGDVVRPAVQRLLARNKYVESFKLAGYFNGQSGAFEVTLKASL